MAETLESLQKKLDDRSYDPSQYSRKQNAIVDELISRGDLQGPNTSELSGMRTQAAKKLAREKEFEKDPIATALAAEDVVGQPRELLQPLVSPLSRDSVVKLPCSFW